MRFRRLSAAPLWNAQRRFYERAGLDAWRAGIVPHHVTSNVALATAYARVVVAFFRDGSRRTPVDVVELGAGSGRFAFLFLRALDALQHRAGAGDLPVRYVMTDVADATIRSWRRHEALGPFVRAGRLDFARFDADRDGVLRLLRSRRTISPDRPATRLVVVANYVFSGLRHDALAVRGGRLHDYLVATRGRRVSWRVGDRVRTLYDEPDLNAVVDAYAGRGRGQLLVPIGALRCLARLAALARDDLLVLVADRGIADLDTVVTDARDVGVARYGALSFPVNFHALRAWVTRAGGATLDPLPGHRHVHVAGFLLGTQANGWPATRAAYDAAIRHDGPDEIYARRRALATTAERPDTRALLSLLDRCGPDPRAVAECVSLLWPSLVDADLALRDAIRDTVVRAWPNYYHLGEGYDVPFALALLLYAVHAHADARRLFAESLRLYGDDAATRWNVGLCELALGNARAAQTAFARARRRMPGFTPAGPVTRKLGRAAS